MPSNRRMKLTGLVILLLVLIIFYVSNGAKSTRESPFYSRTVEAITQRQQKSSAAATELERLQREEVIRKEHELAVKVALAQDDHVSSGAEKEAGLGSLGNGGAKKDQQPLAHNVADAVAGVKGAVTGPIAAKLDGESGKSVAGRKMMKDDKIVVNEKGEGDDGVAKVGNVGLKSPLEHSDEVTLEAEEAHKVEVEMNSILKKGPIIIFSKSYCPHSKRAKHILLDMYNITPAPYVVELDQHELGPALQDALLKSTGRRTVPNVLISGRSIGGGDDIARLHSEGTLIETVQSMGGKRITEVILVQGTVAQKFRA